MKGIIVMSTLPPPAGDKFWIDDTNSFGINSLNAINSSGNLTLQPSNTIQGKMITAKLEIDERTAVTMDDVALKNKVLNMLLNELISAKCIEFTKQQDVATNTTIIRARIFATPDTHVRIIRGATK
jgi:hypothetical protein